VPSLADAEDLLAAYRIALAIGDRIAEEHDSTAQEELPLCDRCHRNVTDRGRCSRCRVSTN
jgi:hypothetical protein